MSLQVVCPVCFQPQSTRRIERNGEPWDTWYCPMHGDISHYPVWNWAVASADTLPVKPYVVDATERPPHDG